MHFALHYVEEPSVAQQSESSLHLSFSNVGEGKVAAKAGVT